MNTCTINTFLPGAYGDMDAILAEAMRMLIKAFLIWLVVINVAAFLIFGLDKWLAKRKEKHPNTRRIPEAVLFLLAILGMRIWHHKTLHKSFRFGMPLILVLQLALAGWAIISFIR